MAEDLLSATGRALLDAMPGTAAIVAVDGTIVAVNQRWRDFAQTEHASAPTVSPGVNYFATCRAAEGDVDADRAVRGLRSVLDGMSPDFSLTYPCHSPTEQRWFRLIASALELEGQRYAVVLHLNVTQSELRLRLLTELSGAAMLELDASGRLLHATKAWQDIVDTAFGPGRTDRTWLEAFDPADSARLGSALENALRTGTPFVEHARLRPPLLTDPAARQQRGVRRMRVEGQLQLFHGKVTHCAISVVAAQAAPAEEARMRSEALRDPLTRLWNRAGLAESLAAQPMARGDAVLCLDLDDFKEINDSAGHAAGDAVLSVVAARIRGTLRPDDLAVRLGGDEFAVVLRNVGNDGARTAAARLLESIQLPIRASGSIWTIGSSIGIAVCTGAAKSVDDLLENADEALLRAKALGKNRSVLHPSAAEPPEADGDQAVLDGARAVGSHLNRQSGVHLVAYPDTDAKLIQEVTQYLAAGLITGEAGLVIATPEHSSLVMTALQSSGIDVDDAIRIGQLVVQDAWTTLTRFVIDGSPDPVRFREVVGAQVQKMTEHWPRVRAYGEMVSVLWKAGNLPGALAVEDLWTDLAAELPFLLVCAYRADTADGTDVDVPPSLRAEHTRAFI